MQNNNVVILRALPERILLINFNIGGVGTTALQDFSEKWEVKREKTLSMGNKILQSLWANAKQ